MADDSVSAEAGERRRTRDQARLPTFRLFLALQLVAAFFFGLGPFVSPETAGIALGYPADEHFVYRLAGAATLGYAVMAAAGLRRPTWQSLRIPMAALLTFNVSTVVAVLLAFVTRESGTGPGPSPMLFAIMLTAAVFTAASTYWFARNEGAERVEDRLIDPYFRAVVTSLTIAAATVGVTALLFPGFAASVAGLDPSDEGVYRLAGAAALGYAAAGLLGVRSAWWASIRVPNAGALTFTALAAAAAALFFLAGGQSVVAMSVLVAASLFTVALGSWHYRSLR